MIGRQLHQYLVTEKIGEGGMGVVWKARDVRLDRDVALKVLPLEHLRDSERRERFIREAKAASALNHSNIVTIYEIDSDQGIDFIAMEYIAGQTLAARLRQAPMDVPQAIHIVEQIADALGRAHAAHIVHRDLKPGNIMVSDEGHVKVLDFGLAKVHADPSEPQTDKMTVPDLTVAGTTMGTLAYMSPEQALGEPVDARSDVFSFGIVAYESFSGVAPFTGPSRTETLHNLHFAEVPPLQTLRRAVPVDVAAVVTRALAKKPEDRYANMMEVRDALRRATQSPPSSAVPADTGASTVTVPHRQRRWPSSRAAWTVAATMVLVASAVALSMYYRSSSSTSERLTTDAPARISGTPYELATQASALLERQDREGNVDRAIAVLNAALSQNPAYALAYAYLSEAYRRKQRDNPDPQWLKLADEHARRALELGPDLAVAHAAQGFLDLDAGRSDEAEQRFRRAAELDPSSPHPHIGLGLRFAAAGRDETAEAEYHKAIALKGQDWRPEAELGLFLYRRGRYEPAAAAWEDARRLAPDNVLILRNLGAAYHLLGRYDEAATALQRALEIRPAAPTYTNLGTTRFFQGRYADAVTAFEKAVELGAPNHQFWGNLADAYRWAPGRRGDSIAAYGRAIDLIREQLAKKPGDVDLRTRLATYLMKRGDRSEALREAAAVEPAVGRQPQVLMRLVVLHELAGEREAALTMLQRALEAGYPAREIGNEPELVALRADARFHRLIGSFEQSSR